MGCCESKGLKGESIIKIVRFGIEKNRPGILRDMLKKVQSVSFDRILETLNKPIIELDNLKLNSINYSVVLGKHLAFSLLLSIGCSIETAEEELAAQNTSILHILCSKGFSEILNLYLPVFLKKSHLDKEKIRQDTNELNQTALSIAILKGHLNIVSDVYKHTMGLLKVPEDLDFEYNGGKFKENSALTACRSGNFHIVKFLYSKVPQLFFHRNIEGQNAVHITCCGSVEDPSRPYLSILKYLVEVVGIDLRENDFSSFTTLQDPQIREWIESEVSKLGLMPKPCFLSPLLYHPEQTPECTRNVSNLSIQHN